MVKDQTVSDHTFRVMIIAYEILKRCGYVDRIDMGEFMIKALFHDTDEAITGDIPSPQKVHNIPDGTPIEAVILKLADTMEAYTYAGRYAVKPKEVERFMVEQIASCIRFLQKDIIHIQRIFDDMVNEIHAYC